MTEKLNQITRQELKLKTLEDEKDNLLFEKETIEVELENIKEEVDKQKSLMEDTKSKEEYLNNSKDDIMVGMLVILLISVLSSLVVVLSLGSYNIRIIFKTISISVLLGFVFSLVVEFEEIKKFLLIKKEDRKYQINKKLKEIECYLLKLSKEENINLDNLAVVNKKLNVIDYRLVEEGEKLKVLVCEKEQLYTDLLMFVPPTNY